MVSSPGRGPQVEKQVGFLAQRDEDRRKRARRRKGRRHSGRSMSVGSLRAMGLGPGFIGAVTRVVDDEEREETMRITLSQYFNESGDDKGLTMWDAVAPHPCKRDSGRRSLDEQLVKLDGVMSPGVRASRMVARESERKERSSAFERVESPKRAMILDLVIVGMQVMQR